MRFWKIGWNGKSTTCDRTFDGQEVEATGQTIYPDGLIALLQTVAGKNGAVAYYVGARFHDRFEFVSDRSFERRMQTERVDVWERAQYVDEWPARRLHVLVLAGHRPGSI